MSTILIIDDEKSIAEMLCRALTRFGYEVLTALNGRDGIALFERFPIDVVLTDMLMPGMDGGEVLRHIRHSSRKDTPVIAMSGTPDMLGSHDFDLTIAKPFSIYELLGKVRFICPIESQKAKV